jgi:signal recognition particle GTPase
VAYYLKSNGVDVMLAACDTYRFVVLLKQFKVH